MLKYLKRLEMFEEQISVATKPNSSFLNHFRLFLGTFWRRQSILKQSSKGNISLI